MQALWPSILGFSENLDEFVESLATPIDTFSLLAVLAIALKYKNIVCYVVAADFSFMFFGSGWAYSLDIWDEMGIFWQYGLGMKDTLVMLILYALGANPLVLLAYGVVSVPSWSLWAVYELVESDNIYHLAWYLWSPLYILLQVLQVAALGFKGGDDGRIARARLYARWNSRYVSVTNTVHNYIAAGKFGVKENQRKVEKAS